MSAENVEAVRELYEHWSSGDWAAGAEKFSEDLVFTTFDESDEEIVMHGLAELRAWLRDFLAQWQHVRRETDALIDCGDRVLSLGHQHATGRASGAELSMPIYDVFTFRDGQIVEFHISRDEGVARRLAGLNVR